MGSDHEHEEHKTVDRNDAPFTKFINAVYQVLDAPVVWFRETVVVPNRKKYPWYHQQYRRVATVDECYENDHVCRFEADEQFKRDKMVDNAIIGILRTRFEECVHYETYDSQERCKEIKAIYLDAQENWFTKYGDLGYWGAAKEAYMKQKHRMVWERRYGPVGNGNKVRIDQP